MAKISLSVSTQATPLPPGAAFGGYLFHVSDPAQPKAQPVFTLLTTDPFCVTGDIGPGDWTASCAAMDANGNALGAAVTQAVHIAAPGSPAPGPVVYMAPLGLTAVVA